MNQFLTVPIMLYIFQKQLESLIFFLILFPLTFPWFLKVNRMASSHYYKSTMKQIFLLLCLLASSLASNPESVLQFFQYCHYHNYPVEDHIVPTDDHYNLQFYRIQAKSTKITAGKRVIYLQHGLVDSSDTWIVNDQALAPAFYLANQGFDVWLGNSRGNRYSNHKLSPVPLNFWDFTFNEMAKYDLPAAFRYINRVTQRKIHYIGHSQGTLIMFIALAEQVKGVQQYLLSFNAFGPVAYLKHQKSSLFNALGKTPLLSVLLKSHVKLLMMEDEAGMRAIGKLCKVDRVTCLAGLTLISEMNNTVNNVNRLPVIMAHFPSGSSTKNFLHFQQFVRKEEFNNFDYGKKNEAVYGQKTPPLYDLSKVTFPVHLYVGKYDRLADVEDSNRLFKELTNSPNKTMKIYDFGHATFVWGKSLEHIHDALNVINNAEPKKSISTSS